LLEIHSIFLVISNSKRRNPFKVATLNFLFGKFCSFAFLFVIVVRETDLKAYLQAYLQA